MSFFGSFSVVLKKMKAITYKIILACMQVNSMIGAALHVKVMVLVTKRSQPSLNRQGGPLD